MSNYNLSRGEELFFKEIEKLKTENSRNKNGLQFMSSLFSGKVGVMPEGNLTSVNIKDEKELFFELDATPSYKKLSLAILYTLQNCKETDMISQIKYVVESYKNNSFNMQKSKVQDLTVDQKTIDLHNEIEQTSRLHQNIIESEFVSEDSNDCKIIGIDSIDLIDDFENEDLTIEGMRSTGMIDTNFDSLSDLQPTIVKSRKLIPMGRYEFDDNNNPIIYCPFTGSSNVYQIDSSTYASFETDQPFRIIFNLADLNPN